MKKPASNKQDSPWSLELVIAIGIPAGTVVAGLFTLYIAIQNSWNPVEEGATDRFGRVTQQQPHKP